MKTHVPRDRFAMTGEELAETFSARKETLQTGYEQKQALAKIYTETAPPPLNLIIRKLSLELTLAWNRCVSTEIQVKRSQGKSEEKEAWRTMEICAEDFIHILDELTWQIEEAQATIAALEETIQGKLLCVSGNRSERSALAHEIATEPKLRAFFEIVHRRGLQYYREGCVPPETLRALLRTRRSRDKGRSTIERFDSIARAVDFSNDAFSEPECLVNEELEQLITLLPSVRRVHLLSIHGLKIPAAAVNDIVRHCKGMKWSLKKNAELLITCIHWLRRSGLDIEPGLFEEESFAEWILELATIPVELNGMLNACGATKIHNLTDVVMIRHIRECTSREKRACTVDELHALAKLIPKKERDVYHLHALMNCILLFGTGRLRELGKKEGVLTSKTIHTLEHFSWQKDREAAWQAFYRVHTSGPERTRVLFLTAHDDHLASINYLRGDIQAIPEDRYSVSFQYVGGAHEMMLAIRHAAQEQQIDILVISAHGNENEITFTDNGSIVTKELLHDDIFENADICLSEHATIYLNVCSSGRGKHPIAESLARIFHTRVVAPDRLSAAYINVTKNGELRVAFDTGVVARSFEP